MFNGFIIFHHLTETDIDNFDNKPQLEHQIQIQEMKGSGWSFDEITSKTKHFCKTNEKNGASYEECTVKNFFYLQHGK